MHKTQSRCEVQKNHAKASALSKSIKNIALEKIMIQETISCNRRKCLFSDSRYQKPD